HNGIDPKKCHFWLTDNTAYMFSEAYNATAEFNLLVVSKSFQIPCRLYAVQIALMNFENTIFRKLDVILPPENHAHEMPDKIAIWIKDLQNCLDNIYELFGEELADAKQELNTADFENFYKLLYDSGKNGSEFVCAFLK
ncbi:20183_t:CDS:2, partial [Racocetra persica]